MAVPVNLSSAGRRALEPDASHKHLRSSKRLLAFSRKRHLKRAKKKDKKIF